MATDLVALVLLATCALLGAWRGAWASGSALAALAGGYVAAVAGARAFGPSAAEVLRIPVPFGGAAAGTGSFLVAALAIAGVGRVLRRAADERRGDAPRSTADRTLGALFGATRGAVLVLLLGVAALWLDAARELAEPTRAAREAAPEPEPPADSPLRAATRTALEGIVGAAVGDRTSTGGALATRVMTHPAESLAALSRVAEHPGLATLADDREFWSDIEDGRADLALARSSFQALAGDPALRSDLAAAGVIDSAAALDAARFRAAVRPVLVELGPRLARLRSDPELLELSSDPALSEALAQRDVLALLAHPGFQRVISRALAPAPPRR